MWEPLPTNDREDEENLMIVKTQGEMFLMSIIMICAVTIYDQLLQNTKLC